MCLREALHANKVLRGKVATLEDEQKVDGETMMGLAEKLNTVERDLEDAGDLLRKVTSIHHIERGHLAPAGDCIHWPCLEVCTSLGEVRCHKQPPP